MALGAIGNPSILAVHTDACKGLENAVRQVFPQAGHRECFFHLMQNFKKRWHGDTFGHMYPAARAYEKEVYEEHLTKVFNATPDVYNWLRDYHQLKWMRCAFNPEIKCDYITNNLAECFNNWVKDIKDLPVVDLAEKLREMIMQLFEKRRAMGERFTGWLLPAIKHQLRARTRGLGHLTILKSAKLSAQVCDNSKMHVKHIVKLSTKECTCLEWQHTGKPCDHALAFLSTQRNIEFDDFVHEYYSVARFRAAYQLEIEPITGKSQWPKVELPYVLGAPLGKRSVGRQRKKRIKSCLEGGGSSSSKKIMIRGPQQCKRCGERGHRERSYKCPLNGTKKRPRKPRKNKTKELTSPATPQKSTRDRESVMQGSPGIVTRSRLAWLLLGEDNSSQPPSSPAQNPTHEPATSKKLTPKKRKRN